MQIQTTFTKFIGLINQIHYVRIRVVKFFHILALFSLYSLFDMIGMFNSINHQHAFILLTFSNWCSHFSLILINYQFAATISQGLEVD